MVAHFNCFNLGFTVNSRLKKEINSGLSLLKRFIAVNYLHFNFSQVQTFESKIKQYRSILKLKYILSTALVKLEVRN